ncbi:hypothetical protein [Meiothermus granaticius]|uniref:Uncharacterized protein n=1 Tax=Meiothermus granaticius NBRC 107808 TaxID=1227551 RepID=A0A399F3N3_9DEIN|nr:hypothetical protein [Meiothermus granaticius]RIH91347.1 hypothetical protein Mgrana_02745 [Meiothermus granaticius NBRC 107808]GEM87936.1 hypothetical protein MGR01S_25610 [Meiothermus granaticius NBRC 107808]
MQSPLHLFWLPWLRFGLLAGGLGLTLVSCQRPADAQPPLIGITQPSSGVISKRSLRVEGYVLDDTGVQSVKAMGQELLSTSNRGQKLVRFSFKLQAPTSGTVELKVEATDSQGQSRTVRLPLVLDARPPQIKIDRAEWVTKVISPAQTRTNPDGTTVSIPAKTEGSLQISGKALDDTGIDRVVVQYGNTFSPLSLPKGKEVSFFIEVPTRRATIIAVDLAGNRADLTVP